MKRIVMLLLMLCMMVGAAMAEGPVLLVELPEDTQMIENIEFDDGDFIQTYQLPDGVSAQLLRYASFDMTLEDLAEGEWTGYDMLEVLHIAEIGGYPAQGMRLTYQQQSEVGTQAVEVYTLLVQVQSQTLIFEAVFPSELGDVRIEGDMNTWLNTMDVYGTDSQEVG